MRLRNSALSVEWPSLSFGPRTVILGLNTEAFLIPHIGEHDGDALFVKRLWYEAGTFRWLEQHAPEHYDLIIEIGANIGIYTVFFEALSRKPNSRLKRIIAFEPSPEAHRRLLANLDANRARAITVINAAIGERSGSQTFFEPTGHLTNGSLRREFAGIFSDEVAETEVAVIGAQELGGYFAGTGKALVKIDAEGLEPEIVSALAPCIEQFRPDLLVEVLPETSERLNQMNHLHRYEKFLVTLEGLQEHRAFFACAENRDWLLRAVN